jgi:hypothetical protein
MKTKNGVLIEKWTKVNDSLLTSISYRIKGNDTTIQETVELKYLKGSIIYSPTVPDQNDGKSVTFSLIKIDSGGLHYHFENKQHDFPQKIVYMLGSKSLRVVISGQTDKGFKEIPFDFVMQ